MLPIRPHLPHNSLLFYTFHCLLLLALTMSNWVMLWFSMEMMMMCLIPLMKSDSSSKSAEMMLVLFIVQVVSSSIMLMMLMMSFYYPNKLSSVMLLIAIMTKLGIAPCHMWLPPLALSVSWFNLMLILTSFKLIGLLLLGSTLTITTPATLYIITMNMSIGVLGAVNQTRLKSLVTYSSITNTSWMLAAAFISSSLMTLYITVYMLTLVLICLMMTPLSMMAAPYVNSKYMMNDLVAGPLTIAVLSLMGTPPFIGFVMKLLILVPLVELMPLLAVFMSILTSITIFYFMSCIVTLMTSSSYYVFSPMKYHFFLFSLPLWLAPIYMMTQ